MTLGGAATIMSEVLEKNSDQIRNYLYDKKENKTFEDCESLIRKPPLRENNYVGLAHQI